MSDTIMNATKVSFRDLLLSEGISQQLIDELALSLVHSNYGQTPDDMHGFVGRYIFPLRNLGAFHLLLSEVML